MGPSSLLTVTSGQSDRSSICSGHAMEWRFGTVDQGSCDYRQGELCRGSEGKSNVTQPCAGYFDSRMAMFRRCRRKNAPSGKGGHRSQGTLSGFIGPSEYGGVSIWCYLGLHDSTQTPLSAKQRNILRGCVLHGYSPVFFILTDDNHPIWANSVHLA